MIDAHLGCHGARTVPEIGYYGATKEGAIKKGIEQIPGCELKQGPGRSRS